MQSCCLSLFKKNPHKYSTAFCDMFYSERAINIDSVVNVCLRCCRRRRKCRSKEWYCCWEMSYMNTLRSAEYTINILLLSNAWLSSAFSHFLLRQIYSYVFITCHVIVALESVIITWWFQLDDIWWWWARMSKPRDFYSFFLEYENSLSKLIFPRYQTFKRTIIFFSVLHWG